MTSYDISKLYEESFKRKIIFNLDDSGKYFKTIMHEIVFYFSINNPYFDVKLGITRVHKVDKNESLKLKKFYNELFDLSEVYTTYPEFNYTEIKQNIESYFNRVCAGL